MPHERGERDDEVAAGAICPMPECGALVVAFRATSIVSQDHIEPWEFACGRCGIEFVVPENELVFQSVPKDWLIASATVA
jgi:hypothetical protein